MEPGTYAIVSYLPGGLGSFVDFLRQKLNPQYAGKAAHVTVLPARALQGREDEILEDARLRCAEFEPFEVEVAGVSNFLPLSSVVYLTIGAGEPELGRLHEALNAGRLWQQELHPYVPHISIVQDLDEAQTRALQPVLNERLARYARPRRFRVETLMFVRQTEDGNWVDLAPLVLGPAHVVS